MRRMLERRGHSICEAASGCATLEWIDCAAPDLLLLDLRLPEIDGIEVLRQVRLAFNDIQLPVIVVTAEHDVESMMLCLQAGANDYVTKPIAWIALRDSIDAHLRKHHTSVETSCEDSGESTDKVEWKDMRAD